MRGPMRSKLLLSASVQIPKVRSNVANAAKRDVHARHFFERNDCRLSSGLRISGTHVVPDTILLLLLRRVKKKRSRKFFGRRRRTVSKFETRGKARQF